MARARYGLRLGWAYAFANVLLRPLVVVFTRTDWRGAQNLDTGGGVIVVANHVSPVDPITLAHFLYDNGRPPRYLAKESLFAIPVLGALLRSCGQIPVRRFTTGAADVLGDAADALARGECVVIYAEGTTTKDPGMWPMRAKTGVARLWWDTRAPVVPVAQWGPQDVLGARGLRPWPPHVIHMLAGPPLDLARYADREPTSALMREIADDVTVRLRAMVGELRGEQPPPDVLDWDAVRAGLVPPPPGVTVPERHRPKAAVAAATPSAAAAGDPPSTRPAVDGRAAVDGEVSA